MDAEEAPHRAYFSIQFAGNPSQTFHSGTRGRAPWEQDRLNVLSMYNGASPHHSYTTDVPPEGGKEYPLLLDFLDGILVGSSALDWNRFLGAIGISASFWPLIWTTGFPHSSGTRQLL